MEFRVRKDARDWFKDIRSELTAPAGTTSAPDFDVFYFCFIAGITEKRKKDVPTGETAGLGRELSRTIQKSWAASCQSIPEQRA